MEWYVNGNSSTPVLIPKQEHTKSNNFWTERRFSLYGHSCSFFFIFLSIHSEIQSAVLFKIMRNFFMRIITSYSFYIHRLLVPRKYSEYDTGLTRRWLYRRTVERVIMLTILPPSLTGILHFSWIREAITLIIYEFLSLLKSFHL